MLWFLFTDKLMQQSKLPEGPVTGTNLYAIYDKDADSTNVFLVLL